MKQQIKIPEIQNCAVCGEKARVIDWDYKMMYRVYCNNNHTATKECATINRAIHRWNNAQKKLHDKTN
jgi:hypothetical protein